MGAFAKGDVVLADLPFSDLSGIKRRPLLVLATPPNLNLIVCMITSRRAMTVTMCILLTTTWHPANCCVRAVYDLASCSLLTSVSCRLKWAY